MDSPLRLIATSPVDRLAQTIEALLVVSSTPLSVAELAAATEDDAERIETALGLLGERYREGLHRYFVKICARYGVPFGYQDVSDEADDDETEVLDAQLVFEF